MKEIIFIIIGSLVAVWLAIGIKNYTRFIEMLDRYTHLLNKLKKDKKDYEDDMYLSAVYFNHMQNLLHTNGVLEEVRIQMEENPRKTKLQYFFSYLLLGPLYKIK